MNVDSLLPDSEFRDAPSDHLCKLESVKPSFQCLMKKNYNFSIVPKNFHVPKHPKPAPPTPMSSCPAAVRPAKPPHGSLMGLQVPRGWQGDAWSFWRPGASGREACPGEWQPWLGTPLHIESLCHMINAPRPYKNKLLPF